MERTIDLVARTLGLEPAEVRRRNMIRRRGDAVPRSACPIATASRSSTTAATTRRALEKALAAVGGIAAFRARQRQARAEGRYLGLGIGFYIEGTGVGPFESAFVRIDPSGKIYVTCGAAPQGQGMETIFSQIIADLWKVAPEDVVLTSPTPRRSRSVSARWRAAAPSPPRRRCTTPAGGCATRCSRSPPTSSNARRPISNCARDWAGSASSACPAHK